MVSDQLDTQATSVHTSPALSLIIPLYLESRRLPDRLEAYAAFLTEYPKAELLLVDDGSGEAEGTPAIARNFAKSQQRVRFIQLEHHRGKGAACRAGIAAADKDTVLLSDCDLSTPLSELKALLPLLQQCDMVVGSRHTKDARVGLKQPLWRRTFGRLGNLAIRWTLGIHQSDTQCGFKLLGPECCRLATQTGLNGAGFDFELIALAEKKGLRILEKGVIWNHRGGSRFGLRSFLHTGLELLAVAWRLRVTGGTGP